MSILVLADAVEALYEGRGLPVHFDRVRPDSSGQYLADTLPWIVSRLQIPTTVSRALGGPAQALRTRIVTTITAETTTGVRVMYDKLHPVLEGARLTAPGWSCSPVRFYNARDITDDETITLTGTNEHPVFTVVEWQFTATEQ